MTPDQIRCVQESFDKLAPQATAIGRAFYDRLFALAPEVRPLFRGDLHAQQTMLVNTLNLVVNNLHTPDKILPTVQNLGARHAGYGADPEHYSVVGQALIDTLRDFLGSEWRAEEQQAWTAAYGLLADLMVQAQTGAAA
nr:hypothetical protein [Oceanococcus sp. HetDA_MAG_MS8]